MSVGNDHVTPQRQYNTIQYNTIRYDTVLFDDNYAVSTVETASLNGFGVSNDKSILKYSCSEYDWTVLMN
jgi:hypothetical protein